jgi:hypothetical protein
LAKLNVGEVRQLALSIIADHEGGIRWAELLRKIKNANPETPDGTISGSCRNLDELFPKNVARPERGLYKPLVASESTDKETFTVSPSLSSSKVQESDFYQSFADWLGDDLNEVTQAVSLGGNGMGGKWSTPDVVGVYRPLASDIVKFQPEIITAEIKIDPKQPVVAFGQAMSYRLFSSKTYVAMPTTITPEDAARLEALCLLFGVGLVLFTLNSAAPNYTIRVRAQRFTPDMFYVNAFAERLKTQDMAVFRKLFG